MEDIDYSLIPDKFFKSLFPENDTGGESPMLMKKC